MRVCISYSTGSGQVGCGKSYCKGCFTKDRRISVETWQTLDNRTDFGCTAPGEIVMSLQPYHRANTTCARPKSVKPSLMRGRSLEKTNRLELKLELLTHKSASDSRCQKALGIIQTMGV
jgi:hypothetical protein